MKQEKLEELSGKLRASEKQWTLEAQVKSGEEQLQVERQRNTQLVTKLESEREERIKLEKDAAELRRQKDFARQQAEFQRKQINLVSVQFEVVGCFVTVRRAPQRQGFWMASHYRQGSESVDPTILPFRFLPSPILNQSVDPLVKIPSIPQFGPNYSGLTFQNPVAGFYTEEDLSKLTPQILNQMKRLKESFSKDFPVKKIEYIFNDDLYRQFDETRSKFIWRRRNATEVLLFHGTNVANIDPYHTKN